MSEEESRHESEGIEPPLDPSVTPALFRQWRSPRFGGSNPERMTNPVWEWLVGSALNAYQATQRLDGPSAMDAGPGWCFDRFGQSSTQLADGRIVLIAGEHEDHYDPDFYIYNDVVVRHPDGRIDIFGYPREVFPPTDFHSATFVGNRIVIIGNLGYPEDRRPGMTPVFVLDLATFAVAPAQTSGPPPGWIHEHNAILSEDKNSILLQRGKLDRGGEDTSLVENIDDWRLHLTEWRWEKLTERRWQRWEVIRKDRKPNHVWEIQQAALSRSFGWAKELKEQMKQLTQELGVPPNLDMMVRLFCPSITHEAMAKVEEEYNVFRIEIEKIVIRYVVDMYSIQMTVEGDLPQHTIDVLAGDLRDKMSGLENAPCESKQL